MRKWKLFLVVATAALALMGLAVATASAGPTFLLAEWLVNGAAVTASTAVDSEGELALKETILGIKISALCSGFLDGTINANGAGTITELLSLAGVREDSLTVGTLSCTNDENCGEPLSVPVHMPWKTELQLMEEEGKSFFVKINYASSGVGNPGYEVECMGPKLSDECTDPEGSTEALNVGSNVEEVALDSFNVLAGDKLSNCISSGTEAGEAEGKGTTLLTAGGTLAVSSTG